jgi:hypothetical protein
MLRVRRLVRSIGEEMNAATSRGRPVATGPERGSRMRVDLDTISTTALALQYVQEEGLGRTSRKLGPARQYLHAYGTLQAIFVQQDAIRDFWDLAVGLALDLGPFATWQELREWRNRLVGHPTGRGSGSAVIRTTFGLFSTSAAGFTASSWQPQTGKGERREFVVGQFVTSFADEGVAILENLRDGIRAR